jgi:hypothetical protein
MTILLQDVDSFAEIPPRESLLLTLLCGADCARFTEETQAEVKYDRVGREKDEQSAFPW